jgi:hypothetical protein
MKTTSEQVVHMPVINPDTGKPSRTFQFSGVVDRVEGGRVIDWKSAADPAAAVRQKRIGFQPELYALAIQHTGRMIDEVEYRIIARPTIRLCGKDKDRNAYEERCVEWLLERPERMLAQVHILTESRMRQAQQFLWEGSKRVLENRKHDRWLPCAYACNTWSRACEFLPLCESVADGSDTDYIVDSQYERVDDPHVEIEHDTTKDTLTHSSLSILSLCECRYYWRYEARLRLKHEYQESTWVGSAMHHGLDTFAERGLDAALVAVDEWADDHPIIGEDMAKKQDQDVARARAMVRAAALRWAI